MFGQVRVEFVFGIVIFSIIIIFIITQTNTLFSSLLIDSKNDILKAKSINVITILVEDGGDPPNWQTLSFNNVNRVGLANQPYNLSKSKINRLNSECDLLNKTELRNYRLKVFNETHLIVFCGSESLEPPKSVSLRYVYVDNGFGNVSLEVW